jgi:hypothetical protein
MCGQVLRRKAALPSRRLRPQQLQLRPPGMWKLEPFYFFSIFLKKEINKPI